MRFNDIRNPGAGDVVFRADSSIMGSGGRWEFGDSLPQVRITNASNKDLKINDIDVIGERQPLAWLQPTTLLRTLTFELDRDVAPSLIVIRSVIGTQKTIVYGVLVVIMATLCGMVYGAFQT